MAIQPARMVPGATRTRRAVATGGEEGTRSAGACKRLAASALSPDPKVSENSDTAKLREMVMASLPKEITDGIKDVKGALDVASAVKAQAALLQEHAEAIRILRGTAMEQDNRIRAALVKLNLTVAATDKLDDAVELVEVDQAAVLSDFKELKAEMMQIRADIESKEVEQDSKLLRLVEQRHIDVRALTGELADKMATVEATFVKAEGMMFNIATDRKRYDQLLADVQAATASSSAAGPAVLPSSGNTEFILLKSRVERLGKDLLDLAGNVNGVRQAVTETEDRIVGSEVHLNDLVAQSAAQTSQAAVALVAEREALLCSQIETAMLEISKGACQCPQGCPGRTEGAPVRQPPGFGAGGCGSSGGGGRAPFLNNAGKFNQGGSGPGGGPNGGGHGGGGSGPPSGPVAHDIFSDDGGHRKLLKSSKSPFDSKAARDELPRYNGKEKAEIWRKKVTYYLHSKNANMNNLLRWAELQVEPIDAVQLATAVREVDSLAMLSDDPEVLSYHLWGFLNVNLLDAAWDLFDGVEIENGLEVWRIVNLEITQRPQSELLALEDKVLTPHRVAEIRDIDKALVAWDADLRNYIEAGGTALSKHRQVGAIMRLIPYKVRDQVLWEFDKFEGKPEVLRKWIKDRTQWFTKADAGRSAAARAHLFDGVPEDEEALESMPLEAMESMSREELCAFVKRRLAAPPRTGAPRPDRARAPPRDKRDVTCPNCGKKGHTGQECKQPKIALKDRKCFECGEAGHIASKCPNKDKARVLTSDGAQNEAEPVWLGVVADSDDVPLHRRKTTPFSKAMVQRPEPRGCTLGNCMGRVFLQMAKIEADEATATVAPSDAETRREREPQAMAADPDTKVRGAVAAPADEATPAETLTSEMPDLDDSDDEEPAPVPAGGKRDCRVACGGACCTALTIPVPVPSERRRGRHAGLSLAQAFSGDKTATPCQGKCCGGGAEIAEDPVLPLANATPKQKTAEDFRKLREARRQAVEQSKEPVKQLTEAALSWRGGKPRQDGLYNFWGVEAVEELNALPEEEEPEFIEVEMTLDTGATVHACDRIDFPGCNVVGSPGSKAGQQFQAAGGKLIPNEGQATIALLGLGGIEMAMTMQIAKITRPLLSVTKMTESGELSVVCKKDAALVMDAQGKTIATFNRKGGLYVSIMKYRNPRFKPEVFARLHE